MAEKKIQENPIPEEQAEQPSNLSMPEKPLDKTAAQVDKTAAQPDKAAPLPVPVTPTPQISVPSFTKTPPNDLYRRLLPAVLFLLTFVTVMTMLLIYMDTVALGAQQFRLNMSRDYELARIGQASAPLVAYVRQLHLAPRGPHRLPSAPAPTEKNAVLDRLLGEVSNGTFIEYLPRGARSPTSAYLEAARGWAGVVVRAAARDYLALRGAARPLHACLSPTDHPREVTYQESDSHSSAFSSRVLCLPLYTVLLAADATEADYVLLGGDSVLPALRHVPFQQVHLQVLDIRMTDAEVRNKTTAFLQSHNYTVAATFPDGIMYHLNE
ncbi:protein Star isoform X2 [Pectinophora gossypiella]|uniref:protein Star isoform X2 n=1 Tax=Pectinophora gossypiella TaxID=13191 RepID=UPI00214EB6CC|nr:protein Star isoform X2 [Pectinophora gossypiella]